MHIKIRPSKINFNVFINSSSSSIKCISIFSGNNVNKVFNAKSFDEKDISEGVEEVQETFLDDVEEKESWD